MSPTALTSTPTRLRIRHETEVAYQGSAASSYNEVRMTPLTLPTQTVLDSRVTVSPATPTWSYWDYWGAQVTVFDLLDPHARLMVTATSLVETSPAPPLPVPPPRAELTEQVQGSRLIEYLIPTQRTSLDAELAEAAAEAAEAVRDLDAHEAATAVVDLIRGRLDYRPGSTGVQTTAAGAWSLRAGVCQDFAHIAAALLRAAGLPARYVSGYLHPRPEARTHEPVAGESHAWVEYWAGDWVGCDPTNGTRTGESHVVVARGREYGDVPPHKGVYHGAPGSAPTVRVEFTRTV
ncbi:transglutaminase-like putative cysteine protease [Streptacidiphilus sp. MAP12-20]|uniref:transglutaminase family protein n=1 Tax=Streptacidiphilus sp. MAP12-20 TaxID=3156299 RepID=UPI0035141721